MRVADKNGVELIEGVSVLVPSPNETDVHTNEFVGNVVHIGNQYVTVEDMEGDCFDIEAERVEVYFG